MARGLGHRHSIDPLLPHPACLPAYGAASSATVGFESKLWAAADALRNNMDAAEYKHVVLGLIFLKSRRVIEGRGRRSDEHDSLQTGRCTSE